MDLSIITVSWNVKEKLRESLRAIFESVSASARASSSVDAAILTLEIFVVDNASNDGTAEMVKQEFPQVRLIANSENRGFSAANNQAIRESGGDFILLLNPDMRVFPDTLPKMVTWMREHPKVGIAGCHLVNEKGETVPHVRRFPNVADQAAILLKLPHLFPKIVGRYLMSDFDYRQEAEVDSIRGSFFMARREVFFEGLSRPSNSPPSIGLPDERFFIWFEEVDFCKRADAAGWKIMYTPLVKCVDYVGQSFKQMASYQKQKMFTESMVKYFNKHHPGWRAWVISALRPVGLALVWVGGKFKTWFMRVLSRVFLPSRV